MNRVVSLERFRELAAAYGSDIDTWPDAERASARALLASSPALRDVLEAEADLDAQFAAAPEPRLDAELARRLLAVPERQARPRALWPFRRVWVPATAWAAAAAFGVLFGVLSPEPAGNDAGSVENDGAVPRNGAAAEAFARAEGTVPAAEEVRAGDDARARNELEDDTHELELAELALGTLPWLEEQP